MSKLVDENNYHTDDAWWHEIMMATYHKTSGFFSVHQYMAPEHTGNTDTQVKLATHKAGGYE